jgi:putative intracellular protease/amidase
VFDFDTAADTPAPRGPTLVEERRPKPGRKGARPPVRTKWAVIAGVAVLGLLVGAVARQALKTTAGTNDARTAANNPDPLAKGPAARPAGKVNPWTGRESVKVLYVIPHNGVYLGDYVPVRAALEREGVTVVTASSAPGEAWPAPGSGQPERPVPVDVVLTPDLDISGYAAVVFCGKNVGEFTGKAPAADAAKAALDRATKAGKPVGAICLGQAVLAYHGFLTGKTVAANPQTRMMPKFRDAGINWKDTRVEVDGRLVTAAGPEDAAAFAEKLLAVIRGG